MGESFQTQIDAIKNALAQPLPPLTDLSIVDAQGNQIAWIGVRQDSQVYLGAWFQNLYVGGDGPATAPFFSDGEKVVIGQNGQVFVLDPYGNVGAWLGTQSEVARAVTGAANNGAGLIRLTVANHHYSTGDNVSVASVGGVPNATGNNWIITVIDANYFDLRGSVFAGGYTAGGTATRFFAGGAFSTIAVGAAQAITGVANAAGLVRVTVPAHGYFTGYAVVITGVNGVTGINGLSWLITVIDADHFDLVGSTFAGAYVNGGQSINWPTAKLIARDDGSLSITGATFTLTGNGVITTINNATNPWSSQGSSLTSKDITSSFYSEIDPFHVALLDPTNNPIVYMGCTVIAGQGYGTLVVGTDSGPSSVAISGGGASVTLGNGVTTTTIDATNVDSPGFSVSGIPGIDLTKALGISVTVGTASFGTSLTVNTGTAVTNVTGVVGLVLSTGTFVTGVSLNVADAVDSVVLNTESHTWTKGLLTA